MALLDRLFSTRRKLNYERQSRDRSRCYKITSEQVRLLLFKECDRRGRKLLFDSSTVKRIPKGKDVDKYSKEPSAPPYIIEMSKEFAFVYAGPAADAPALGEMIFGAVALSYRGVSFKIHITDQPCRLMCTKIFSVPHAGTRTSSMKKYSSDSVASSRGLTNSAKSINQDDDSVSLSYSFDRGDSGFYGDHTPYSSVTSTSDHCTKSDFSDENSSEEDFYTFDLDEAVSHAAPEDRKLSACSSGSWQRRAARRLSTRFDVGRRSDSQLYSSSTLNGGVSDDGGVAARSGGARRPRLGLALLVTLDNHRHMDGVRRCLEQSARLRALVRRLRRAALAAGTARARFTATLVDAADDAARWLSEMLYGPRAPSAWLGVAGAGADAGAAGAGAGAGAGADGVLTALCHVLVHADTKHTNFFMSTLLTHVLTYHLGWVSSVSPYECAEPAQPLRAHSALWAQLVDLRGAVGRPSRRARTLLCGGAGSHGTHFLDKLLFVLTYFIRCGDVTRHHYGLKPAAELTALNPNSSAPPVLSDGDRSDNVPEKSVSNPFKRIPTAMLPPQIPSDESIDSSDSERERKVLFVLGDDDKLVDLKNKCNDGRISIGGNSDKDRSDNVPEKSVSNPLKRIPTVMLSPQIPSDESIDSSDSEREEKVLFVLGDDDKLVGLKNKCNDGRRVKKSSKIHDETGDPETGADDEAGGRCCAGTLRHSEPIKHSGFKFEFDKYPQIVTNYMKSKNLEILDRHYIGKPGNLKLDNLRLDPTGGTPTRVERCETCTRCRAIESTLQTPTNASELEFTSDMPGQAEPQFARPALVGPSSPKTFVRKRKQNTVVVDANNTLDVRKLGANGVKDVTSVLEFPACELTPEPARAQRDADAGVASGLLGGLTDRYVPDLVLQATSAKASACAAELERELALERGARAPPPVAIVGDTDTWQVRVLGVSGGGGGGGGMSTLVATMLEAVPHMRRANVPAAQCLSWVEGRLREVCVLSKTLADVLMSRERCDLRTLTRCLAVSADDVPLLLAVAGTHTPQLAARYGLAYR